MNTYHVAIIGVGPRGLNILERIKAIFEQQLIEMELVIHLIDPGEPGQGTHVANQLDYFLVNTIAGQITMFSDTTVTNAGIVVKGQSLLEWASEQGYRYADGSYIKACQEGRSLSENDYLPRSILGAYLTSVFDKIVYSMPSNIKLRHYRCRAENLVAGEDNCIDVVLEEGYKLAVNFVFLTIGHSQSKPDFEEQKMSDKVLACGRHNPHLAYFHNPYPITKLTSISPQASVVVQGMGLTAYDVIAQLTVGRGGRFIDNTPEQLWYKPSGREPQIMIYSRQSLPFSSRGVNEKGISGQYQAKFFTRQHIDQLRQRAFQIRRTYQLDFFEELYPLLFKEMCYVYEVTKLGIIELNPQLYVPLKEVQDAIEYIFNPLKNSDFKDHDDFKTFVLKLLEDDIVQAFGGNVSNPLKATTDMLRDVRDNLRYAVDYSGLTPSSHKRFLKEFCPIINRIAVGPPKERNIELLALIDAGIVKLGPGPNSTLEFSEQDSKFLLKSTQLRSPSVNSFDVLIRAKLDSFYPTTDRSKLIKNLLRSGMVTPYKNGAFHPGGIAIDESQNIVTRDGKVYKNIWALGVLVEGPNFYTYVLPRPFVNSKALQDAGRCVLAMLNQIVCHETRPLHEAKLEN
ncbi:FAD/NAD(P)-binding protein [Nostoc punctiforme UO1]|uniref:FAD/NAD(P)-binding protein n=1 Tax=Nostoc punctiforme TaxID=272131 RepID=UPI0030A6E0A5